MLEEVVLELQEQKTEILVDQVVLVGHKINLVVVHQVEQVIHLLLVLHKEMLVEKELVMFIQKEVVAVEQYLLEVMLVTCQHHPIQILMEEV